MCAAAASRRGNHHHVDRCLALPSLCFDDHRRVLRCREGEATDDHPCEPLMLSSIQKRGEMSNQVAALIDRCCRWLPDPPAAAGVVVVSAAGAAGAAAALFCSIQCTLRLHLPWSVLDEEGAAVLAFLGVDAHWGPFLDGHVAWEEQRWSPEPPGLWASAAGPDRASAACPGQA
nr:hypothetical protein Iba_chr12bCG15130 [Ipomoea batatas]